jgi:uncharacterized lipoprotein YddW (UPF0748 family)
MKPPVERSERRPREVGRVKWAAPARTLTALSLLRTIAWLLGGVAAIALAACGSHDDPHPAWVEIDPATVEVPDIPQEFRGLWVASVANIDWPSRRDLDPKAQQAEAIRILDLCLALHLNAVVLQVRPSADALYASRLEPWSEFLVGTQGAPSSYDPLQFWIHEAHARAIDLHVWINPFRARHRSARSNPAPNHVSSRRPELVVRYGEELWLDPGMAESRALSLAVIEDLVRRYDLDGVHLDDYFYPYPIKGVEFPDEASYAAYRGGGGTMARNDWRRRNIDGFVRTMYERVKAIDPQVLVGISPFGVWRPDHPPGVVGLDAYDVLHADSRLWLRAGWLDYVSPQLYWPRDSKGQPFGPLLDWWAGENVRDRHLWPGLYLTRIGQEGGWPPEEIEGQIDAVRGHRFADGVVLYSAVGLLENRQGVHDLLAERVFATPALVPASPWLFGDALPRPEFQWTESDGMLRLRFAGREAPARWLVEWRRGEGWFVAILPGATREHAWPLGVEDSAIDLVRVQAISRVGERSEPVVLRRREPLPIRPE